MNINNTLSGIISIVFKFLEVLLFLFYLLLPIIKLVVFLDTSPTIII